MNEAFPDEQAGDRSFSRTELRFCFQSDCSLGHLIFSCNSILWRSRRPDIALGTRFGVGAHILNICEIRVSEHILNYFIFTVWREIPYEQIRKVGWSIFPGLGYVQLRTFLPPWGRLYFVVEERSHLKRELTSAMREILEHARESQPSTQNLAIGSSSLKKEKRRRVVWIALSAGGALSGGLLAWWNPTQLPSPSTLSGKAEYLRILVQLLAYINQPILRLGLAVILLLFLLHRRFQDIESLVAAFVMGGMAASLIRVWISH